MRQNFYTCVGYSDHKRAGRRTFSTTRQSRCVGRADDADDEDAANVEYQKADKECPGRFGKVSSRRLHLARRDNQQLRRKAEGEGCRDDSGDEGHELALAPRYDPGVERAWIAPVAEVKGVT